MLALFPSGQVLTQSSTKLFYEISGVFNLEGAEADSGSGENLLEQLRDFAYEEEIFLALLNRFGDDYKWKKFSFISEDQVTEFQIRDAIIDLNFSSEGLSATGSAVINAAGDISGAPSFINYLGKILKFVIEGVIRMRFKGVSSTFKISFIQADKQSPSRLAFLKR